MDYNELFSREYTPAHATVPESAESVLKLMGARNGHFDIEKFKATGAAAACAEMMENTIVNVDEHSPESIAFWAKRGMVKEIHGEDKPMDWAGYLATHEMEAEFDPNNTFPQNLVKKWSSFVPVSAFDPANKELYPVDESRVYVAGFSYGSRNTNFLAAGHPEWFAAAAPCGGFIKNPYNGMYPMGFKRPAGPAEPWYACIPNEEFKHEMPIMSVIGNRDGFPFPVYDSPELDSMADALSWWGAKNRTAVPSKEEIVALKEQSQSFAERALGLPLAAGCGKVETDRGTDFAIGDFKDENGVVRMKVVCEDNHPHWPTPHLSEIVFDFFDQFARNPETGESIVRK